MNKLDPKEIVKNAIDGLTYSKAYDLYLNKKITLTCKRNDALEMDEYEGIVKGKSNKAYPVTAIIDKNGKVVKASCKCDYYLSYPGYCKHILAFLLQISEITNKKDTSILSSLLQYYKKSVSLNISLTPIFYSYKYDTGIEFKIGKPNKKYFVKDIPEMYDNIANNYYFKYGKELEFLHTISAFDQISKTIIEDLSECIANGETSNKSYFDGKRRHSIPKIIFKKILDMYKNQQIELVLDEAHFDLIYTNETPDFSLIYNDDTLSIKDRDKIKLISIGRFHYLIKDGKLFCIDETLPADLIPLITTLYIRPIQFNTRLYNEFFTYIYPKVKDLITIENQEQFEKKNNCSILDTTCYLDLNDGILSLKYKFEYEGKEREEAISDGIFPNIAMEENFTEQLNLFNFKLTVNKNEYILDDSDDVIEFLLTELDELKTITTVYISDSIKNLKPLKSYGSPVGIRYENNWLELFFNETFYSQEELKNVLESIKKGKKYHLLKDGTILNLQEKFFTDLADISETVELDEKAIENKRVALPIYKILQLDQFFDFKELPKETIKFLHDIRNFKDINYPIDKTLLSKLRSYQKDGENWLINLAYYRLSGILADDMGLGKTLEIITLLKSCVTKKPNLIVCPASLTYNWLNEFKKWTPNLNVLLVSGNQQTRDEQIKSIQPGQIVITSYDYLKRDIETYEKMSFYFFIIDEAQAIKNHQTKNAETVKKINSVSRFALTGTPIENSLADLWSIFDFCLPGYLKTYEKFKSVYEYDIVKNHNSNTLEKLNKQIAPFILRRTKSEVLSELPPKFEQVIYAPMSEEQQEVYNATLLAARQKILESGENNKIYIFSMLTRLRQICCHPSLYVDNYVGDSAKLNLTNNIIYDAINSNHRILIFSQFTSMLDILSNVLTDKQISHYKLTGQTPPEERIRLVDSFNKDESIKVFLISLKAGGTGLNLTGADTVIHYDPWWNISSENQASDRVHRIGQKNTVHIIKVITKDSIEEKVLNLQTKKKELFDKVVNEDSAVLESLSNEELLSLFDINKGE